MMLLAPLSRDAGGFGFCTNKKDSSAVFSSNDDADYKIILAAISDAAQRLDEIKRFDMPGFQPCADWVREMKRYGILPTYLPADAPIDYYAAERDYWKSLWYVPGPAVSKK